MRISHTHKFIFLANPRTGSTTVRNLLDNYSDIKSVPISQTSESFPFYHHISAAELKSVFVSRGWDWDRYWKFCFVRNPYDRVVSLYHHKLKMRKRLQVTSLKSLRTRISYMINKTPTFHDYVINIDPRKRLPTSLDNFLFDEQGTCLVEDVLMFERLHEDLPGFLDSLDIPVSANDIPHLNTSSNRKEYRAYYDEECRERVYDLYRYEFERFGYTF
jgi:hypothetical protein